MALVAPVQNGKVVETDSQNSLSKATQTTGKDMDKDTFLQLLVAQMKYQDPMEPTSNTEYIAQYAQFSQVEAISNMSGTMEMQRASALVGKNVYIRTTDASGESKYIEGKVDYVVYENNKPYLSINENLYSIKDLDTVVDTDYKNAYNKAESFTIKLNKLPAVVNITISGEGKTIDELGEAYKNMSDYEKSFIASDTYSRFTKYAEKLAELRAAALTENTDSSKTEETTES